MTSRKFLDLGHGAYSWMSHTADVKGCTRVSMFDLDDTLVRSAHHLTRHTELVTDSLLPGVVNMLRGLLQTHPVVIVTNQGGMAYGNAKILPRIEAVLTSLIAELGVSSKTMPLYCYIAGERNTYRKPMSGLFEAEIWRQFPNATQWIYVGDAAGREGDFSSTDRKFAYNIDLLFQYWELMHKQGAKPTYDTSLVDLERRGGVGWIIDAKLFTGSKRPRITFFTPEEYFAKQTVSPEILAKKRAWWGFWPAEYLRTRSDVVPEHGVTEQAALERIHELAKATPLVILMIGYPGSGKTTFARAIAKGIKLHLVVGDDRKTPAARISDAKKALADGYHVLIDATHASKTSRIAYQTTLRSTVPNCTFLYVEMETYRNMAYHMNQIRAFANAKHDYVPEVTYNRHAQSYQAPQVGDEIETERYFRVYPKLVFARPEDRFRFLQFTEEGAADRMSTLED